MALIPSLPVELSMAEKDTEVIGSNYHQGKKKNFFFHMGKKKTIFFPGDAVRSCTACNNDNDIVTPKGGLDT